MEHEVDVVFSGHEHIYERMEPQNGVVYFVAGASGAVRIGDLRPSSYQAFGYDRDLSFMLIEIAGDALYFRTVNRLGETIDRGKIVRTRRLFVADTRAGRRSAGRGPETRPSTRARPRGPPP